MRWFKLLKRFYRRVRFWSGNVIFPLSRYKLPIFVIVGAAGSGTSILGELLGKHRSICCLDEPREMWRQAYPETYIWMPNKSGKIIFTAADNNRLRSWLLRRFFYNKFSKSKKQVLVEKLPINCFRLPFIRKIFPEARYIFTSRNGLDVAKSMDRRFGKEQIAVQLLEEIINEKPYAAYANSNRLKHLLCWKISVENSVNFLSKLPASQWIEVSYQDLAERPEKTAKKLLAFMGIGEDEQIIEFARENISYRHSPEVRKLSDEEKLLGGKWLELSMKGEPLVPPPPMSSS